jgi:FixJ family two-component response regulator
MLDEKRPALVAIIEDDAVSRRALGRLLLAAGFEPSLFDSAEAFIASESGRAWLCLIVDVKLPGMSGIDLQQKLRREGSDVPIIITTGNRADIIRERAQLAGCLAFLWKPFTSDTLLELLGSISRQTHPDPKDVCTNGQ